MITRLFRSRHRLDSSDPASRRAAIEALSEEDAQQNQTTLIRLATEDPQMSVRIPAIARLCDEPALRTLLDDPAVAAEAVARVLALSAQGRCADLADEPRVLAVRLPTAEDPEALGRKLLDLGSRTLLIDTLLDADRAARTRLLELPLFDRQDVLQELERRSRDRDKTSNRLARQRLDWIRQRTAAMEERLNAVEERLTALEKPAADTSETERIRRTVLSERIAEDLAELGRLTEELTASGTPLPALDPLRARFDRIDAEPAPEASETTGVIAPASPPARPQAADSPGAFDDLAKGFEHLDALLKSSTDFAALSAQRQSLTEQWLTRADQVPPTESEHAVFERVSHRFQALAEANDRLHNIEFPSIDPAALPEKPGDKLNSDSVRAAENASRTLNELARRLDQVAWPAWAPLPPILSDQQALLASVRERSATWQGVVDEALRELEQKLDALDAQIEAGDLARARTGAGEIRKRLQHLPERSGRRLSQRLARASARLEELGDWQTFATEPKRQALLTAMREIADTPLSPPDQADRIRALRKEWNGLGGIGRSGDRGLMDAFNEAAERAFEPCRAHFEAQAAIRAENLAAREGICESLSGYLNATDWSNADFRAAERILRTAREEWRAHHPVDRDAGRPLETRFEALQAELHQHITSEWDRNLATKRQIVADAQALAASDEPLPDRAEGAKRLQHQWKTVGPTPRRPDQTLWREFRAACDTIFESREAARRHADEEVQAAREAYEQLLSGFRQRLDDTSAELDADSVRTFQQQFNELPELPQSVSRAVEREHDELVRAAQQILGDQRAAQALARLRGLEAADEAVSALEQQQLAGETVAFTPPDPLFSGRCQPGADPVTEEDLLQVVIEAEIAAGLDSEESDLRMRIQVELMNAGRGREALDATPETLTRRWCELGPKGAAADPLRKRFFQAIGKLLER